MIRHLIKRDSSNNAVLAITLRVRIWHSGERCGPDKMIKGMFSKSLKWPKWPGGTAKKVQDSFGEK